MSDKPVFIDRRRASRRSDPDPCSELPMDLYHRKRRKSKERRAPNRTLAEDYYAFTNSHGDDAQTNPPADTASEKGKLEHN